MNYLVIDFEMCKVPRNYRSSNYPYAYEIIQIGAVLLNEAYEQVAVLSQYVHPEHGVIDRFIANLTGIQKNQVKKAPKIQEAILHLMDWIGEREYFIMAWSETDRNQLMHEMVSKKVDDARIEDFLKVERWIDYQDVFDKRFEFERSVGLQEALTLTDISPEGRFHDGLDDAVNTGKLITKLETQPDYQITACDKTDEVVTDPLSFSMGDLFKGLMIQSA